NQDHRERHDKGPRTTKRGNDVRHALTQRGFLFDHLVWISVRTDTYEMLRTLELPSENGHHVESRIGFAVQQHTDIIPVDFDAGRVLSRERLRLMRSLRKHRSETEELSFARLVDE